MNQKQVDALISIIKDRVQGCKELYEHFESKENHYSAHYFEGKLDALDEVLKAIEFVQNWKEGE